ncbi:2-phosphosulfolactate phosphatase [Paenibacillus cremeus]|uniref:Probable 2-phosphosulfolactate phosphatase n=1 Tax=Paenibacillus cremeus TaxID=2163881 RepID=A0A559KAG9_9BACL|nr:2-phosphosulfolactate phosphatase [Paenibacillus cremeus]TVY09126.1 2-phosphosulfolactate phosphatase [Paenibacillus cremeus]
MFNQSPYNCRMEWGSRGAREAAERGDITIIVDVLSFSSATVTALQYGAVLYPYPPPLEEAKQFAETIGGELLLSRAEAAKTGARSLSPLCFTPADKGKKIVVCSLNGAACVSMAAHAYTVLVGCLLNASAAAQIANELQAASPNASITVVACGEQWDQPEPGESNLRPGIEDYLGAGAILSMLNGSKSPEALVCIAAYETVRHQLDLLIWDCGSGRELRQRGFEADVTHATQLNTLDAVPQLRGDHFIDAYTFK